MAKKESQRVDQLAQLQADNTLLGEQLDALKADLQRVQADFINYRRRSEESRSEILELAKQSVILEVLPLIDNIGRGLAHLPTELEQDPWAQGVKQVGLQADEVMKALDIERIETLGQSFNPHFHEAIGFEDGEGDHEVIVEELQPGYRLGERVIRPAIVKVGKSKPGSS